MKTYTLKELDAPLFVSRSAEIYAWEGNCLLKLFNEGFDQELISMEELNTTETFNAGVSLVECFGTVSIEGRTGIILSKVEGVTLLGMIFGDVVPADETTKIAVDLHLKMHQATSDKIINFKDRVRYAINTKAMDFLTEDLKQEALARLNSLPDGNQILHLDCHHDNMMSNGTDHTIIDWTTAATGVPAIELATMNYLFNEAEMIPGLPEDITAMLENLRHVQGEIYMNLYKEKSGITDEEMQAWQLFVWIVRLGVWNVESEGPQLREKILSSLKKVAVTN
ncbi:MAG: phosphotransferase [Streptococcaceae bacterium]|jgi:streptomycin 6-kinase|nr:phosphotransferase [Streptococcaceae bacterium]